VWPVFDRAGNTHQSNDFDTTGDPGATGADAHVDRRPPE